MMHRLVATICAAALFCGSGAAFAQDAPVVLEASSPWHVDYAEKDCRLLRTFGDSQANTLLSLSASEPGESVRLVIAGPRIDGMDIAKSQIVFGPGHLALKVWEPIGGQSEKFGKGIAAVVARDPATSLPMGKADWASIKWAEAWSAGSPAVRLELGEMSQPLLALRKCIDDLAADWEIDLDAHWTKTQSAHPIDLFDVLSAMDFPSSIIGGSGELVAEFRLLIDEAGKPTKCVTKPSDNPRRFDDRVCEILLRKARFKPARDVSGHPMKSYFNSTFRYQNPR